MNRRGNIKHGGTGTLTYARWKSMMQRCYCKNASSYKYYGGSGIAVCDRWREFPNFLADMGECPDRSLTLDRIKNEFGYQPGNCRWATRAEQNRNRPNANVILTHNGITQNMTDWAQSIGMNVNVLGMRVRAGWSAERALTTPVGAAQVNRHPRLAELTYNGKTMSVIEWATSLSITPNLLRTRLRLGWSVERALRPHERKSV